MSVSKRPDPLGRAGACGLKRASDRIETLAAVVLWVAAVAMVGAAIRLGDAAGASDHTLSPVVGVVVGMWSLFAGWVVIALLWLAVVCAVQRHNLRRWGWEWSRIEPVWAGRT